MKKALQIIAKIALSLILIMPILGALGVFPEATRDLYSTDQAFAFIEMLVDVAYINYIMSVVFLIALVSLWARREALAALLLVPITINIIAFHAFLDGGLFTAGAVMANVLLSLNAYFLWKNRERYQSLLGRS